MRKHFVLVILVALGMFALGSNYSDWLARLRCSMELGMSSPFYGACIAARKVTSQLGIPQ
jgi:hypothetical protein